MCFPFYLRITYAVANLQAKAAISNELNSFEVALEGRGSLERTDGTMHTPEEVLVFNKPTDGT